MEAPGIESPVTFAPIVAQSSETAARDAARHDAERRDASASRVRSEPVTMEEADAAIRVAAMTAIDARDYRRARALLDLLEGKQTESVPLALVQSRPSK